MNRKTCCNIGLIILCIGLAVFIINQVILLNSFTYSLQQIVSDISFLVAYAGILFIIPLKKYREMWRYVFSSRFFIYSIVVLFFASALIGFFFSEKFEFVENILRSLLERTSGLEGYSLISFIFWNNLKSSFFGLILGILLGVFPIITTLSNGVVLGYVFQKVYALTGYSDFWRIFPHGIFELPAIFISLGLGLKLGMFVFHKSPKKVLIERIKSSLVVFLGLVIPLLLIAAIIEGLLITFS